MYPWPFNPYPAPDFWFGWPALPDDDEELHAMSTEPVPTAAPADASDASADKGRLFTLATKPRHVWRAQTSVAAAISPSGHEQREWRCERCPVVRITVMPSGGRLARREWRYGNGSQFIDPCGEPACVPVVTPAGGNKL